jgi:DMSO/TMAO reductase YedYZ molybdopterin-dependent catalytic subunit
MDRGLHHEHDYDLESAERRAHGLTRRQVLRAGALAVGVAAVGPTLAQSVTSRAAADVPGIAKPTPDSLFVARGTNAEMRWSAMRGQGYLTPIDRFFVRNHTSTPRIDATTWRQRVHGTGVEREVSVSYDDLLAWPQVSLTRFIECAGNGRSFFGTQQGQAAAGTQWTLGAIGVAEWTGVRLSSVLERAGIRPSALDVMPVGLDDQQVRRPVPLEKALADDTLLVLGMNGRTLPPDHGFPARILVPGWVGVANIKWVGSIEVSETPLTSQWNTTSYRMFGPAYPDSPLVTTQVVKSAIEQPMPASLRPGRRELTGRSWSAYGRIRRVEISVDNGPWRDARLGGRNDPQAWRQWSAPWVATPGDHVVRVRATDEHGNGQPDTVPFNEQGYLFGAVVDHPVAVA